MPSGLVKCNEENGCFGMHANEKDIFCTVLIESYPKGFCPFKKERREVTKGKRYPSKSSSWPSIYRKREFGNREKGE